VRSDEPYIIRGGVEGRDRLRVLARVLKPTTTSLLDEIGVARDAMCLDVGCGGGDVTLELARRAPDGHVVGIDLDDTKLELARGEAAEAGAGNVEYRREDVLSDNVGSSFDLVYARFLLTHLTDPASAAKRFAAAVRPGGVLVIEDVDFEGSFCYPDGHAFRRYLELYSLTARARGADPDIGRRLPALLDGAGCRPVHARVVQPVGRKPEGIEGDVKLAAPITLEAVASAIVSEDVAGRDEVDALVGELYALARDEATLISFPRILQAWGYPRTA
jgi:SAM-dependent methyltransferase